jgi:hypothetical protein
MADVNYTSEEKRILWFATVKEVDDPLMLNRVRVSFDTKNNEAILKAIPDTKNGKQTKIPGGSDLLPEFKWSEIDSFCCLPLLPIFLNVTPKKDETVNIIWPNPEYKYDEQYYVQGTFSSPLSAYQENFNAQRMFASKNRLQDAKLLKNPLNNEYYISKTKGVFIEPEDIGLMGRGTCDIVVKSGDVLLRAGKSTTIPQNANKEINAKKSRSFIQLSDFGVRENPMDPIESIRLEQEVASVKTLVEWDILNPENAYNKFTYTISLYNLPEGKKEYNTQNLQLDSVVSNSDKRLVYRATYNNKGVSEIGRVVSQFISQCNDGTINLPDYPITTLSNQFPLYFRPSPETYKFIETPSSGLEFINVTAIGLGIDYKSQKNGFGLLYSRGKTGQQFTTRKDVQKQKEVLTGQTVTYNILGADKMLFLSHESRIQSKQQIILDESTIYGIEQSYLVSNVLPNTDPMVRGDELMKLINIMVRFLISHVHPFPGIPPVPTSQDGTKVSDILQQLASAPETILNQNLRIN